MKIDNSKNTIWSQAMIRAMMLMTSVVVAGATLVASKAFARVDAIYSVPTNDAGLIGSAEFPTRSDQNQYGNPNSEGLLRFSLPMELVGRETDFELIRQTDGKWVGTGTDGSKVAGTCATEGKKWFKCSVEFTGLIFDAIERETILSKQFGSGFEFDQRTKVARHFEGQPIGIIKVRTDRD